jgi:hypothetical protein
VQASLNQQQRLQQLFLPEGIAFDGNRFNRTAATAPLFKYLAPSESADESVVTPDFHELEPDGCLAEADRGAPARGVNPRDGRRDFP